MLFAVSTFHAQDQTAGTNAPSPGEATLLFDRQMTKAWDAFLEYAGDFPEYGGTRHLLHFGTAYKLTPQQQIDFHAGVGLSPAAVDHFIGSAIRSAFRPFIAET
jgi:hypothetical protein